MNKHPLAASFERLTTITEYLKAYVEMPAGDDWFTPNSFFAAGSPRFAEMEAIIREQYQTEKAGVLAGVLFDGYQWGLIATSVACYLCEQRVPSLEPADVLLRLSPDQRYVDAVTYCSGLFSVLPNDPAADHPDATIVPTQEALREQLRCSIEGHMDMMATALARRFGINEGRLWPSVADRIAGTIIWLGKELYEPAQCACTVECEIDELLRVPNSQLTNRVTGTLNVIYNGCSQPYLRRATCCQAYRCPDHGYCNTCPKRPVEERMARLREYLMEQQHNEAA